MIIVIDDERDFAWFGAGYSEIVYARTSDEGIAEIAKAWTNYVLRYGDKVALYLDHDLGENDTIMPVVDFLYVAANAEAKFATGLTGMIEEIYIHSQNPTAGDTIIPLLAPLYNNVKRIPLPDLI
jgi:hypothetical protein